MSDTIRGALLFLVNTVFDLYLFVLVIRLILVWVRSDYFNPVTQFIVKMTDKVVRPVRRVIPNKFNIEFSTLLIIFVLEIIKYFLVAFISFGMPNPVGLPILAIADFFSILLQTFSGAIIFQAILSFLQPMHPIMSVLQRFTSPIMGPLHRLIPPIGGFDITPIPALLLLQFTGILLVTPLLSMGTGLSFG